MDERHLRFLFDHLSTGLAHCQVIVDGPPPHDFVYLDVNASFEALTGLHDVVGKRASEVIPGILETEPELLGIYAEVASTGRPRRFNRYLGALGKQLSVSAVCPEAGQFIAIFEVTADAQLADALRESRERRRSVERSMTEGVVIQAAGGGILSCNQAAERILGLSRAQLEGRTSLDPRWRALRADGLARKVSLTVQPVVDANGAALFHFGLVEDVPDRRRAHEALRASEARFRNLFESHSAVMLLIDPADGLIVDANPAAARFYGYAQDALRGMPIGSLNMLPRDELRRAMASAADTAQNTFVFPHRLADGQIRTVEIRSSPATIDGRTLLFSIVHDVTERERAIAAITRERQRYRSLMDISQDGIHLLDDQGHLIEANRAFLRMIGQARVDGLRVSDWDAQIPPGELVSRVEALIDRPGLFQTRHRRSDGSVFDVEVHAGPVELDGRRYLLAASRDVSARRAFEEALATQQAQLEHLNRSLEERIAHDVEEIREKDRLLVAQHRQAAIGELIGYIAHQWRQPLKALGLVLSNLRDASRFGELDAPAVEAAYTDGTRLVKKMSSTINDFRDFLQPDKENRAFSALAKIGEAVTLLDASFRDAGIALEVDAPADVRLFGVANEYSHVLMNLLSNAKQAIQSTRRASGRVTLRLVEQDGFGCLTVRDDGGGIADAVLGRLFEAYVTTREGGTGIGLYMSRKIVERSFGGSLEARNVEGGAELTVRVPVAEAGAPGSQAGDGSTPPA